MDCVAVTGCAGFIGTNFINYIIKNKLFKKIIGIDKLTYAGRYENISEHIENSDMDFYKCDICNYNDLKGILIKTILI